MLFTNYQITEIVMSTLLFPLFYFLYLFLSSSELIYWDIIWCSFALFCILVTKAFYINFYLMQMQNQMINNK